MAQQLTGNLVQPAVAQPNMAHLQSAIIYNDMDEAKKRHKGFKLNLIRTRNNLQTVYDSITAADSSDQAKVISHLESSIQSCDARVERYTASVDAIRELDEDLADSEMEHCDDVLNLINNATKLLIKIKTSTVQGQSQQAHTHPSRINDSLKPERLHASATLAEFRSWRTGFELYHSSNKMDQFPVQEQQGYLRACIELKLQQILSTHIATDTPINGESGCLETLRSIFLQNIPVLTRRYNFFRCDQKLKEKFSDWYLRLQLEGQEAELNSLSSDDLYVLRLVTGTSDMRLREEFLRQAKPTHENLRQIAMAWESASLVETSMTTDSAAAAGITSYKKNKSKPPQPSGMMNPHDLKGKCYRCGEPKGKHAPNDCPAKNEVCKKCSKTGHYTTVCTGGRIYHRSKSHTRNDFKSKATPATNSIIHVKTTTDGNATPRAKILVIGMNRQSATPFHMQALPDTGATATLVSRDIAKTYGLLIDPSRTRTILAANESSLRCDGATEMKVNFQNKYTAKVTAYVTPDLHDKIILSWQGMMELGMIPPSFPLQPEDSGSTACALANNVTVQKRTKTVTFAPPNPSEESVKKEIQKLFSEYPSVFDSSTLKPMKGTPMHIHLHSDTDIKPTHITVSRNIPFAYREKTERELQNMVKSGIIEPVTEPSTWVSPSLVIPKPDGSVRLVVDYTGLNKYVKRPIHPFPSAMDVSASIPASAKWFVVLDAVKGYWQIELDEESRALTTFLTPYGRFRYCRAPMGLNASGDEYCSRGDKALAGLSNVRKIVDDILVVGNNLDELRSKTKQVLERCNESGITLSSSKAQIGRAVKFAGYIIASEGVRPDPEKVASISKFPAPANITDLRSFLGLTNQLGQFVPDLAHVTQPLRSLLRKDIVYQWLPEHQEAFDKAKKILIDPNGPILAHFDPSLPTTLLTDASRLKGLGFALMQTTSDGTTRLIQCGSRYLSDAETRYAVCELEALAIQWAINRCRLYLLGARFTVVTDHKPLLGIFKGTRLDSVENPRLQRILQKVAGYTFEIKWVPGNTHQIADALSRAPVFDPKESKQEAKCTAIITAITAPTDPALESLISEAKSDTNYQAVKSALLSGLHPKNLPSSHPTKLYAKQWDDLSVDDSTGFLILQGHRIVVPSSLRQQILHGLHRAHQGLRRTRSLAQELYFWPGITNDITQTISTCRLCQESRPSQTAEPLLQTEALRPFHSLSADLFEVAGKDYLVVVDRYSGWPSVTRLNRTDTKVITNALKDWFNTWGIPERIRTDGGPQFRNEFKAFCEENNIVHEQSSAYHAPSNGHAEAAVKAMKHLLQKHSNWQEFQSALLEWRNIPRADGLSPAQRIFGNRQRTRLPAHSQVYSKIQDTDANVAEMKRRDLQNASKRRHDAGRNHRNLPEITPGTEVRIQNPKTGAWNQTGTVKEVRPHGRSYYLQDQNQRYILRNRKFLKPLI